MSELSEQIFSIDDISRKQVPVKEWNNIVIEVRSLPLAQRNAIAVASRDKKGTTDTTLYYPRLVIAASYVPGSDEKVFSMKDVERLGQRNSAAMDRLAKAAMELSGVMETDDEEKADEQAQEEIDAAGKDFSSVEDFVPSS